MDKEHLRRIGKITGNAVLYLFLGLCVLLLLFKALSQKDAEGAASAFGYQMRIVTSDSMAACEGTDVSAYEIGSIPIHSMVFIKQIPGDAWFQRG